MQILNPAPLWQPPQSDYIVLWHGCTAIDKVRIEQGISLDACEAMGQPVVLRFRMRRHSAIKKRRAGFEYGLDALTSLAFVTGDYAAEDYWSFVQHCRQSTAAGIRDHRRPPNGYYDLVSGPVSAFWDQRAAMAESDQFSFHTRAAIRILDALIEKGRKSGPKGDPSYYAWSSIS